MSKDEWFMRIAYTVAMRSKDPSTKVGAVIVEPRTDSIVSTGYNGFSRGSKLDKMKVFWEDRDLKYPNVIHAEVNAVGNAAAVGTRTLGCTLYSTLFPCNACAKSIIAAGITRIVTEWEPNVKCERWGKDAKLAMFILQDAGVATATIFV